MDLINDTVINIVTGGNALRFLQGAVVLVFFMNCWTAFVSCVTKREVEFDFVALCKFIFYGLFCFTVYIVGKKHGEMYTEAHLFFNYFALLFSAIEATDNFCKFLVNPLIQIGVSYLFNKTMT